MLPELGATYGVSAGTASISVTAYLLPFAAVMLVSGTLGERWGRRRTVVLGYAVYVLASVGCVLAGDAGRCSWRRGRCRGWPTRSPPRCCWPRSAPRSRRTGWAGRWAGSGRCRPPGRRRRRWSAGWPRSWTGGWPSSGWRVVAGAARAGRASPPPDDRRRRDRPRCAPRWRPEVLRMGLVAALGWGVPGRAELPGRAAAGGAFGLGAGRARAGAHRARRGRDADGAAGRRRGGPVGRPALRAARRRARGAGRGRRRRWRPRPGWWPRLWALGGVATQLVLVGVNALVLGSAGGEPGRVDVGGAGGPVRRRGARPGGGHAGLPRRPVAGFLVPAAARVAVPVALPRPARG